MISIMVLVVLVVYLSFVIAVSLWVHTKPEKISSKWLASIGIAIFLLFIPVVDDIVGEVYFKYLCATQGGFKVYQTVELGSEYFDKNGIPYFYDRKKTLGKMSMGNRFFGREISDRNYSKKLNIGQYIYEIFDKENNQVIGEYTRFIHFGGILVNSTGLHVIGEGCPSVKVGSTLKFINRVFRRENITE